MNSISRKLSTLLLILLASQSALIAQNDTTKKEVSKLLELSLEELMEVEITTASRKQEKVREAPATVYVITKEDIMKRGYVYLKDVLRDLPGMETIENYSVEAATLVPVRGVVGNNKIVVLVNGIRVNPPGGEEMKLASDFNILQAKQIEVMYGLGSTLYGQDAINAIINVITEQPKEPIKLDVMAKGGMYDYKEGVIALSSKIDYGKDNYIGISTALSYTNAGLSNIAEEYPAWWEQSYGKIIRNTGLSNTPKRFDKGLNAFIKVENNSSSIQLWHREASRSTAEGGNANQLVFTDNALHSDRITVISANNDFKFSEKLKLVSSIVYRRYELDHKTLYVSPISDTALKPNYVYALGNGVRVEEMMNYELSKKVFLKGGIMASFFDVIPRSTFPEEADPDKDIVSQANVITYYTRKGDPTSKVVVPGAYDINYHNYGSFLEGNFILSKKLKAILGMRIDADSRFEELPLSPRAALIYNPDSHFTIKYIYNRGYLAPSPFYMYGVFDIGNRINSFNADLKPERASSNEINISYSKKRVTLGSSVYYNLQENLIFLGDAAVSKASVLQDTIWADPEGKNPKKLTTQVNSGNSRAWGFDVFGKFQFNKISGWASFSYVNFERDLGVEKTGLNRISPINARLGLSLMPIKKLTITPSIIYRTTPDNFTNTFGLDKEIKNPYEINTYISFEPFSKFFVFIDLRNITNHKYALRGLRSPAPQEPFRIMGGIRFIIGS